MKSFNIFLLITVCTLPAIAQNNTGVRFGLQLSPQISWMGNSQNVERTGSRPGFAFGLMMDINIPKNYAFATGISVSYEGGELTYKRNTNQFNSYPQDTFAAGTSVLYRLEYLEIPLSIKLKTNQIGYITYYGQFGLMGGINIRSRADITPPNEMNRLEKVDFGKDVGIGNLSLLLGGGIEYELSGNTALNAGLQFTNGFIDVTDNPNGNDSKNILNHFRLQLGIFF